MTNGYQQFFKKAQQMANTERSVKVPPKPGAPMRKSTSAMAKPSRPVKPTVPASSKKITELLRERAKTHPQSRRKKFPFSLVASLLVGLSIAVYGLAQPARVEKMAKSFEISMMEVAGAEEAKPAAAEAKKSEGEKPTENATKKSEASALVENRHFSDEEIDHFSKLNERKLELDARESELNRLEA